MMNDNDVILAGIPRGGTTLTCALLDRLPNTYALHEPMRPSRISKKDDPDFICQFIEQYFRDTRQAIMLGEPVVTKHIQGRVRSNHVSNTFIGGKRYGLTVKEPIVLDKPTSEDFLLIVKHPSFFTAVLNYLVESFRCFAIIRNPLSLLGSWNTVSFNVRRGYAPNAQRFNSRLKAELDLLEDQYDRQIQLLSWFFDQYTTYLPDNAVLRYEDIVSSGGSVLSSITEKAKTLQEDLENRNASSLYDHELMRDIGRRLLDSQGSFWHYYSRADVELLMDI